MTDVNPKQLAEMILSYYNALCKNEEGYPLPCIMTTSKKTFSRSVAYVKQAIKLFNDTPQKRFLEGILKIATEYCDSPE